MKQNSLLLPPIDKVWISSIIVLYFIYFLPFAANKDYHNFISMF